MYQRTCAHTPTVGCASPSALPPANHLAAACRDVLNADRLWGWQGGNSCAFKDQSQQAPSPTGAVAVTWDAAPACEGRPYGSNAVRGADGQLWGYEHKRSCAFRTVSPASQAAAWAAAPRCSSDPSKYSYMPVRDSLGRLWGYEGGVSCRLR